MVTQPSWDSFQKVGASSRKNDMKEMQQEPQQKQEAPSWGQFQTPNTYQGEPDPVADESTFGYLLRNTTSNIARAGERYLGRYGDVERAAKLGLSKIPGAVGGLMGQAIQSMMGQEAWDRFIGLNKQNLPTSEDVKKLTMAATGDYTKPRTKGEERTQNFVSDVGSMASGKSLGSLQRNLLNKVGIPAAANAASETVKELGFGEKGADRTKLAAMLALSFLNVNAPAYAASLMNKGRQGFNADVTANIPRYEGEINAVSKKMLQGDPRAALAQQQLAGIRNDISNGQTSMRDLMNRYDALNAAKRDRGLFQLGRGDRKSAVRNINEVRDSVRKEIDHLGQANPEALKSWQDGVKAFSVIHKSKAMSNLADQMLTGPYSKATVTALFGAGAYKAPLAATGAAGAILPTAYKAGQIGFRVWQDPNLANYYWNAMRDLAEGNGNGFINNFVKLNNSYERKYGQESER